jgi:hypothetical protein
MWSWPGQRTKQLEPGGQDKKKQVKQDVRIMGTKPRKKERIGFR